MKANIKFNPPKIKILISVLIYFHFPAEGKPNQHLFTHNKLVSGKTLSKNKKPSIVLLDSLITDIATEVTFILNGNIICTGDCNPFPLLGLVKKNNSDGWDTLMQINSRIQLLCGPSKYTWSNDTLKDFLPYELAYKIHKLASPNGIYRLLYLNYKNGKNVIKSSNPFRVTLPFKTIHTSLSGYCDTINCQGLTIIHYRVFTSAFNWSNNHVWHRIRVYNTYDFPYQYIFQQTFIYDEIDLTTSHSAFELNDYNKDGKLDFKIRSNEGGYKYYLYHTVRNTFDFSELLSNSTSFKYNPENTILTLEFFVDGDNNQKLHVFAEYKLPELNFLSARRIVHNGDKGDYFEAINEHQIHFPIHLTLGDSINSFWGYGPETGRQSIRIEINPQPTITTDMLNTTVPEVMTNKRHYFQHSKGDSVLLVSNGIGELADVTNLNFVIEQWNNDTKKWEANLFNNAPLNHELTVKNINKTYNGYTMKLGFVMSLSNLEFAYNELLLPGVYRLKVLKNEKIIAQTDEFYVHEN